MAVQNTPPLSRFLRMAVVAGVERAVQIHIDRGDDLNARDDKGQTPLMLSAARNIATVCKLLLAAGADAGLLDPSGRSALGIAQAEGALEAASAIEAACLRHAASFGESGFCEPEHAATNRQDAQAANDQPATLLAEAAPVQPSQQATHHSVRHSTDKLASWLHIWTEV